VAAITLVLFAVAELRSKSPMLQLGFFRNATFLGANMVGIVISFGFFGVIFFLSLFLQEVQGYSPIRAGLLQLPCTLAIAVTAVVSGRVVARVGSRAPMTIGLALLGASLLGLTMLQPTTPYSSWWYWLVVTGVGMGLIMSPMTSAIMGSVPAARAGMASATSNTLRQVGSVFGIAVLGNLVTRRFTGRLSDALSSYHLPPGVTKAIMSVASQGRQAMPAKMPPGADAAAIGRTIGLSFTSGIHLALWVSGLLLFTGIPFALVMVRGTPRPAPEVLPAVSE
jgi:predicted MFS family arabinose efflux permease